MKAKLLLYNFIGNAAYPMRPWFYSLFTGEKEGLFSIKAHWNFVQLSLRMALEKAFGISKRR